MYSQLLLEPGRLKAIERQMVILLLTALQSAASAPDIDLHVTARMDSLRVEKSGRATLTVRAEPDSGSTVEVQAPKTNGERTLRNAQVTIDAEARIGGGATAGSGIALHDPNATEPQTSR